MILDISYTERSWAIDLIAHIKSRALASNRKIKNAGGEQTIRAEGGLLFPDVLLFGDHSTAQILQGWELKMPDTSIDNSDFYQNAVKKAQALGLDSFILWNVTCARLYCRTESNQYILKKQWPPLNHITDRVSVPRNHADWKRLADTIITDLNALFEDGSLEGKRFIDSYRTGGIQNLILANTPEVANALVEAALRNSSLKSEITLWWDKCKQEYGHTDKYQSLAQANLLNWIGKFLFAHILQSLDNNALTVTELGADSSPSNALEIFRDLSQACNFWTVFSDSVGLRIMPPKPWSQLMQLNRLLTDLRIGSIDQRQLATALEIAIETAIRKVRGQYTTPPALAKLMTTLALRNVIADKVLDPCCGSGTIARTALEQKMAAGVRPQEAAAAVFASDIDHLAVQIATLAMVTPQLMNIPLRIFCHDIFFLEPQSHIPFIHSGDGSCFTEQLGNFNAVVSNFPFVSQAGRSAYQSGISEVTKSFDADSTKLSGRSDIAAYLPFALHPFLAKLGRLVVIISNAWLASDWGDAFCTRILQYYKIKSVITSGAGRWFQNSKVVANLLVLEKRESDAKSNESTDFIILKRPLEEIAASPDAIDITCAQIELGQVQGDTMSLRSVPRNELLRSQDRNLSRNAHFVDCDWIQDLPLIPLRDLCKIRRGERRGWDKMFYPTGDHNIECEYLQTVLKSPTEISRYSVTADNEAFCCSTPIEKLEELQHTGALGWIRRFEQETNTVNRPLPEALAKPNMFWYEMTSDSIAELVVPLNFGERLFVARMDPPAFVNQRLIRLNGLPGVDIDLLVALLNSAISLFCIEGLGFGRGEGALDLSATQIKKHMYVLDPQHLDSSQAFAIKSAFQPILSRDINYVVDECELQDRQYFDDTVIKTFNLPVTRNHIYKSLKQLVAIRLAATEIHTESNRQ